LPINKLPTIYIGYDPREHDYVRVLDKSIRMHTSNTYNIVPIVQSEVRRAGLYWRSPNIDKDGNRVDTFDGKPFSTEFSFTRFLVPFLNQMSGLALFMDADMFVTGDITEIFDVYGSDKDKAISCVQHMHEPSEKTKMDGKVQTIYYRKNWSSFVLWNCDHPWMKELTIADVNVRHGGWLHSFEWMDIYPIGDIDEEWNWLDGTSPEDLPPKNIHFTTGGPIYPEWKGKRDIDNQYADEWRDFFSTVVKG
jgi:lipopolysaccharide biosynthesis glycosyltransferase